MKFQREEGEDEQQMDHRGCHMKNEESTQQE
jgi:hypothetical protein